MVSNNRRFDLSDRLIHFFREVDLEGPSAPLIQPEMFAFNSYVEDTKWPALFLLRCAIRSHRLWATWSMRKNVRTIFGPRPAVCFSEMPIAAFLESSEVREAAGQAMSTYALTFPKTKMHSLGANPVIYGLTDDFILPTGDGGVPRLIAGDKLPLREQYRYVTYNPSGPYKVDWLHEREWRWPHDGDFSELESEMEEYGIVSSADDIPGFDFSHPNLQGIGVIVKTDEDARRIRHDVLTLIDRGKVSNTHFDHILIKDRLPKSSNLYTPLAVEDAIDNALLDFSSYFNLEQANVSKAESDFSARVLSIEKGSSKASSGRREYGGCWLWLHDNSHPYVRALLQAGRVKVNKEGRYIASLDELNANRDLRERENLTKALAVQLKNDLQVESGYFSVLDSHDPDMVPFYIDCAPDDDLYHNTGSS
jgi:hypothetical protein